MAIRTETQLKRVFLRGGLRSVPRSVFDDIDDVFAGVRQEYRKIANQEVVNAFGPLPQDEVTVIVDGVPGKPIGEARLFNRLGVNATTGGNVEDIQEAVLTIWNWLVANAPVWSGRRSHSNAIRYGDGLKVRRVVGSGGNYTEQVGPSIDFSTWNDETSSVEIFSTARHASPLEVLRSEACIGAAYSKFKGLPGITLRFQYKSPDKYNQETVNRKRDGEPFFKLVVPVLTIASIRNKALNKVPAGRPNKPIVRGRTFRNIREGRTTGPGKRKNLQQRGIYKGPVKPRRKR